MDKETIKDLIEIFEQADIAELEVEQDGLRVRISADRLSAGLSRSQVRSPEFDLEAGVDRSGDAKTSGRQVQKDEISITESQGRTVEAPMVGVFYSAPSPDSEPYVKEGDLVKKGDVLCIIEAMKLMNEISSPVDGRIAKIHVENEQLVEFEQIIFTIV